MKTSLEHLPESKRQQIQAIAALVQAAGPVEMVVLFGSYARGDWVEDPENGYFSDFDVLAVVATEEQARNAALWTEVGQRARERKSSPTESGPWTTMGARTPLRASLACRLCTAA